MIIFDYRSDRDVIAKLKMDANVGQSVLGTHNLPQIPRMGTSPRKAVSKASVKDNGVKSEDQTLNIVPCDTVDNKTPPCTPLKDNQDARPPSSMPTPPSEPSPGNDCTDYKLNGFNESGTNDSISVPSPRKRLDLSPHKQCDSPSGETPVIKCESPMVVVSLQKDEQAPCADVKQEPDVANDTDATIDNVSPMESETKDVDLSIVKVETTPGSRAKTKGDIKKKLQKKRNSKAEPEVKVDPEEARAELAKATLAKRAVLLKVQNAVHVI